MNNPGGYRNVLVTRTGQAGARLSSHLESLGYRSLHLPLIELQAVPDADDVRSQFAQITTIDGLILTSQEGVRQAHALGFFSRLKDIPTIVPGAATAEMAAQLGLRRLCYPTSRGTSEAMLALDETRLVAGQHWLILAASEGRRLLDRTLRRRGAQVHRLNVYRRCTKTPTRAELALLNATSDWVTLIYSGSALERLERALPDASWRRLQQGTFIVPSDRLGRMAQDLGASRWLLSQGADNAAMLAALRCA